MEIEERLVRLEKKVENNLPGTSLIRILKPDIGFGWSLGIGQMHLPKKFFLDDTIEGALKQAEKHFKIDL